MPLEVAVYAIPGHKRSTDCCLAMMSGIRAVGDRPRLLMENTYTEPAHDVAVFYGYNMTLQKVRADYMAAGRKIVYIDLGYWGREGRRGHHKIVVNDRHPTAYFQKRKHDGNRVAKLGIVVQPWQTGGKHILLAGMGSKAATAEGVPAESFEREAIRELKKYTDRPIVYRPKPSWLQARPIPGTSFDPPQNAPSHRHLVTALAGCHAVVTHHSNVAVDGLVAGIPAFCWKGVATAMAGQELSKIETPYRPDDREAWVNAISYCQWDLAEMHGGLPWKHLKNEGLI